MALGARAYDIVIGRGLVASLGERIKALRPGARVAIVTDDTVGSHHLKAVDAAFKGAGVPAALLSSIPVRGSKS